MIQSDAAPRISIVIPTHNRPQMLRDAINSCLAQTVPPLEVIVVNDMPNDLDSEKEARQLLSSVPLIYLVNDKFSGAPTSRNLGATTSKGQFIAFLDDDDILDKTYLEVLTREIEAAHSDVLVTWTKSLDVRDKSIRNQMEFPENFDFKRDFVGINPGFAGSNICFRRETFFEVGMFDPMLKKSQDLDLFIRVSMRDIKIHVIPEHLCIQRINHGERITAKYYANRGYYETLIYLYKKHASAMSLQWKVYVLSTISSCVGGARFSARERVMGFLLYWLLFFPSLILEPRRLHRKRYRLRFLRRSLGLGWIAKNKKEPDNSFEE